MRKGTVTIFKTKWIPAAVAAAKSLQSCPTLCDPIDGSPPVSPVPGILQARTLEWVAISSSNVWKWKVKGSRSVVSNPQRLCGLQPSRLLRPWDFPGKSTNGLILFTRPVVWVSREGPCVVHLTHAHVCSSFLNSIDPLPPAPCNLSTKETGSRVSHILDCPLHSRG